LLPWKKISIFAKLSRGKIKKRIEGEKNKRGGEIELFLQVVYYPIK
jgi:hypothetical protein